ncbi:MAG TPA: hypothetical protein VN618_01620 [Solirubrobacteraceae bacterium]|nr:hypothetical protein [Solirubrobacteraceae bacterium]
MRSWRRSNRETGPPEQPAEHGREGRVAERSPATASGRREGAGGERRRLGSRAHGAAGATAGAIGSGVLTLARLVMMLATLIAVLIALAIVLRDVDANASNSIVKGIHEGANFFAGAFTGLIRFGGHPKRAITVDWGIALLVYLLVGAFVSRLIASVGRGGLRFGQRHRAAASH